MKSKILDNFKRKFIKVVIYSKNRSVSFRYFKRGRYFYLKEFDKNDKDSMDSFACELEARDIFNGKPWIIPIIDKKDASLLMRYYEWSKNRLDLIASKLSQAEKTYIAHKAIAILFDVFLAGYAHRDAHAGNFLYYKDNLLLTDFETLAKIPLHDLPPFPLSYDLTGKGLESPFNTENMCFEKDHQKSLKNVLNVSSEEAIRLLIEDIKQELLNASASFHTNGTRKECNAQRIYNSFELPFMNIPPSEAQRDSYLRFKRFGITKDIIEGKTLLDLGCNTGGMIFAAQKFLPKASCGYEIDFDKITIAKKIAAFNGLTSTSFYQADIDTLQISQKFDVVFCLAIEAHVKDKKYLFELLGDVTKEILFFEGNSTSNVDDSMNSLVACGFHKVEFLGFCDDDCRPENNNRPLIVARK